MDIETGDKTERREQKRDQWGMETEKQVKKCEKINAALWLKPRVGVKCGK